MSLLVRPKVIGTREVPPWSVVLASKVEVLLGVEARVLHLGSCNDWPKQPWGLFVNEFSGCVIVFLWPLCTKCQGTWQQRNEPVWASRRAISVVVQRYSGYNP
ncbi:hypothetical protein V6N12_050430 [Hibiscus sabdariffa]|uniref:Uncharacterized protein n=1 Tax=Hibiscus sabdariffa TaxID=183260 RepID=A0ABR2GCC4_9ROSI